MAELSEAARAEVIGAMQTLHTLGRQDAIEFILSTLEALTEATAAGDTDRARDILADLGAMALLGEALPEWDLPAEVLR